MLFEMSVTKSSVPPSWCGSRQEYQHEERYCDVTMIDQISPGSLTAMPFTLQLHPGAPGGTREFTRDDSRVTFPKSLAAFYPGFHPRDLSRCDITRVHPGEIAQRERGIICCMVNAMVTPSHKSLSYKNHKTEFVQN